MPAMNLSRPGPEGTAVVLWVRLAQVPMVQVDRDPMVQEAQGLTVQPDQDPTVRVQSRRTPARALTVQLQDPVPTAQRRGHMVREDRDPMVLRLVSSALRGLAFRRVLAPDRVFSVR